MNKRVIYLNILLFLFLQSCDEDTSDIIEEIDIDTTAPILTIQMHAINRGQNEITLSWMTNEFSTAKLYLAGDSISDSLIINELDTNFSATLINLELGSEYIITLTITNEVELETTYTDTFYTLIADFALYDGMGTWAEGVRNEKNLLNELEYTWVLIKEDDINSEKLYPFYKALWMPGGWAGDYKDYINTAGEENIVEFINKGNFYLGSCAGGYYASDSTIWDNEHYDNPLGLFYGIAIGPINEIATWPAHRFTEIIINHEFEPFESLPDTMTMMYYGGAYYQPYNAFNEEAIVLARYPLTNDVMALIEPIGKGYYYISGCHPEVRRINNPNAWPFMEAVINWTMEKIRIELP